MVMNETPVFAPPDSSGGLRGDERPVDLVFLARQTGGDRALEEEVLRLFAKQAAMLGNELRSQEDADLRKRNAHTLKGAARAVGAFGLADCALQIESEPENPTPVTALLREVETVRDYIASLLR
jgi:HPt (histidine-containing phosphotransfer) domain-containing protein